MAGKGSEVTTDLDTKGSSVRVVFWIPVFAFGRK